MPNPLDKKRSILIGRHKTSVSLESGFWDDLKLIAASRSQTVSQLITAIDGDREQGNLSSVLRIFVLSHYRKTIADRAAAQDKERSPVVETGASSLVPPE
jgi:predicted DNA-binding ribbon-helix-helix protein